MASEPESDENTPGLEFNKMLSYLERMQENIFIHMIENPTSTADGDEEPSFEEEREVEEMPAIGSNDDEECISKEVVTKNEMLSGTSDNNCIQMHPLLDQAGLTIQDGAIYVIEYVQDEDGTCVLQEMIDVDTSNFKKNELNVLAVISQNNEENFNANDVDIGSVLLYDNNQTVNLDVETEDADDNPQDVNVQLEDISDEPQDAIEEMSDKKFACPLCSNSFSKRHSLITHIMRLHTKQKPKQCPHCTRAFTCTGDLTRHIRIHTGDKPFKCPHAGCKYAFISSGDLLKHKRRHTKDTDPIPRPHICVICSKDFDRPYDLKRHAAIHKISDPDFVGFKCEYCDKKFTRKDQYRTHTYRHLGLKPFKCEVCGREFGDQSNCSKHVKLHQTAGAAVASTIKDEFICDFCKVVFKTKSAIAKHFTACNLKKLKENSDLSEE